MPMKTLIAAAFAGGLMLAANPAFAQTVGPQGESATPSADVILSDADIAALKDKGYKAALLWHTSSDFTNAVTAGATDEFARAGITIAVKTDAQFDSARQRSDIETALAAKPNVILALPLDPVTSAEAFRQAVKDGTKLVFLSNLPKGYKQGTDYASIVTDDLFQMGKQAADAMAKAIGGKGKVGYIFHDAAYYVTNQRDQAFKTTIEKVYPDIKIVAEQGISDPARAEELANAMLLQHPDLDGIYVTWAEPADGVLSALRGAGNARTKIVTLDLAEPVALDMVKGGNVAALVADKAYELGRAMAASGMKSLLGQPTPAYELGRAMAASGMKSLLGQPTPAFVVAPALTVTKENVAQGWKDSLNRDAPQPVLDAAK
ncbi:substrate-binding domain-containing protein [Mesorhizobium sp. L2C067A000]|uniref:substrate-binding domain-containing protein n=1 Tax=Mesorhizobium sp. L2C067A000 TaxID=1287106 RepID=UPI0004CF7D45|nr:substrate-binding domain-containing protein [Mesorhizobium sp. L2C067A000]